MKNKLQSLTDQVLDLVHKSDKPLTTAQIARALFHPYVGATGPVDQNASWGQNVSLVLNARCKQGLMDRVKLANEKGRMVWSADEPTLPDPAPTQ